MVDRDGTLLAEEWRRITKQHPGKKYERKVVAVAMKNGTVTSVRLPDESEWARYLRSPGYREMTHWMPMPLHPSELE